MKNTLSILLCGLCLIMAGQAHAGSTTLTWDSYADTAEGFRLYRLVSTDCMNTALFALRATITDVTATRYVESPLPGGMTYCYYVTAYRGTSESIPSNTAVATMPLPAGPVNLQGTVFSGGVTLTWGYAPATSNPAVSTMLYRSLNGQNFVLLSQMPAATTTFTDMALTPGATVMYYLITTDSGGGQSVASATVTFRLQEGLRAPAGLSATIGP